MSVFERSPDRQDRRVDEVVVEAPFIEPHRAVLRVFVETRKNREGYDQEVDSRIGESQESLAVDGTVVTMDRNHSVERWRGREFPTA